MGKQHLESKVYVLSHPLLLSSTHQQFQNLLFSPDCLKYFTAKNGFFDKVNNEINHRQQKYIYTYVDEFHLFSVGIVVPDVRQW